MALGHEQFRKACGRWKGCLPQGAVQSRTCCSDWNRWHPAEYHLLSLPQALEEDLNQKKREQEMFFKLSEEAEPRPTTPSKASNFFPYSSGDAS